MEFDQLHWISVCKSMISVCNAMARFGVPTAVVMVQGNRFLFANECFLQMVGLTAADLSTASLLKIVRFPSNYRSNGERVSVTIRARDRNLAIEGHIECGNQGLAYAVIPSQFHQARDLSGEQEQQRPATYLSSPLASKLIALNFSVEFIQRSHGDQKSFWRAGGARDSRG